MDKELTVEELLNMNALRLRLFRTSLRMENNVSDLSDREMLLLELIGERGELTISEITARYSSVSQSTISVALTRLWRKKLIGKKKRSDNQRMVNVSLTKAGLGMLEEVKTVRSNMNKLLLSALQTDEQEEAVLKNVLKRSLAYFNDVLKLGA